VSCSRNAAVSVAILCLIISSATCARTPDRAHQLESAFDASRAALRRGELVEARALADRGLSLAQADSEWAWTFRLFRGEVLLLQHQPSEVVPLVNAVLPESDRFEAVRARQKYLEARLLLTQNRLADALAALDAAGRYARSESRDIRFDIGWLGGQIRMRLGQWSDGEARLNDVIAQAAAVGDRYYQARALNDLGMGALVRGRWDEALPRFERVLAFKGLEGLTIYGEALNNAGICYARLGEFARAVATQRRAVDLHRGRGPRLDLVRALGELGNSFLQSGDPKQALPYLRQALSVATEANLRADAAVWAGNLAAANIDIGEWNEAERFNDEAKRLKTATGTGKLVHNTLNAALIAQGRGRSADATRLFEEALAGSESFADVRWAAHAGLARVAIAQQQPARASRHFEAALDTIEKTRSELLRTEYKLSFLTRLIEFYRSYVDALVDQGNNARALEVSESSRGRVLSEGNGLTPPGRARATALRQIAARSRSVLLSYWLGAKASYVWVVDGSAVRTVRLPPAGEIEPLVREYRSTIDNALADPLVSPTTAGERLYRALVEPVRRWIPAGSHIVIVPDGSLHGINFETLPVPGARRHYWIEDVEIQSAPALSLLSVGSEAPHATTSLLLLGNPSPREPEFPGLKYASAEMEGVAKNFRDENVAMYSSERASPAAYTTSNPARFSFIHFTAHAAANLQSPLDSAVILSGASDSYKLYARDVANVPLRAELVTVSACRSAGERSYSGEGLIGFAWAFLRAGSNRVVAGLWDVDDRSTVELMSRLYANIAAGERPAHALRAAKLSLIAKSGNYAKPYYWGPFQMFTVVP
jgi:CHAT domain-containing protein